MIHSLRHTMLTRIGEAGVDAFTIMKIAGHSSITVSQRDVHPSTESLAPAFERLEALNTASGRKGEEEMTAAEGFVPATVEHKPSDDPPISIN